MMMMNDEAPNRYYFFFFFFLLSSRIVGSFSIIDGYLTRDPTPKYNPGRYLTS